MLLLVPSTRPGFSAVAFSHYLLLQFWLLARSKTLTWRGYASAFAAGLVFAPLIGIADNLAADALGWPMPDPAATVWISGPVEETLKLLPLLAVLVLARHRARRLAAVDFVLLAAAGGAAFQYVEDAIRRMLYRPSLLAILLGGDNTATQYSVGSLFPGWMESADGERFAGHAVTSALIGAALGLAVRLRPRVGRLAYALPGAMWLLQVLGHSLYNNAAVGGQGIVPGWLQGAYAVAGAGHLERPLLVALLVAAVTFDLLALDRVAGDLPPIPGGPRRASAEGFNRVGARLAALPPADAAPVFFRVARAVGAAVDAFAVAATQAWRELAVTVAAAARGPQTWFAAMGVLRERRELGTAIARRSPPPRPPGDRAATEQRVRRLAAALAVLALLAVIAVPGAGAEPAFLAGLFDRLGEWWNGLPLWQQFFVIAGVAALLTFAGMGFLPALGVVSTASSVLAHGQGIATFLRDPREATRSFFRDLTPAQAAGYTAGLILERVLPAAVGGLVGRGGRRLIGSADDLVDEAVDVAVPSLRIPDAQFGRKIGKHAQDYGLDPSDPAARALLRERIEQIHGQAEEIRQGPWNPSGGGSPAHLFFRQGEDVVVTGPDGTFVTILRGGAGNGWFRSATVVRPGS